MPNRLTLKDVAAAAGVSQITVSRVVRGEGVVSARTRDHVTKVIQDLGFVPNKLAGALSQTRSNQVAVLIPSLVNNVFAQVLRGITEELAKAGYNPVVGVTNYNVEIEEEQLISMLSWRPAAVIMANRVHTPRTRKILEQAGVPVVELMQLGGEPIDMAVGFDHVAASTLLVDYLVSKGHRSFGYIGWINNDFSAAARFTAIKDRLAEKGFGLVAPDIFDMPPDMPMGKVGTHTLLSQAPEVEAIFYSNDIAAIGGALHCLEHGMSIPADLALAGYSGLQMGQALPQPLTTIRTFRYEIGRIAARNVLKSLTHTPVSKITDVGFELVEGETV